MIKIKKQLMFKLQDLQFEQLFNVIVFVGAIIFYFVQHNNWLISITVSCLAFANIYRVNTEIKKIEEKLRRY